MSDLKTTSSPTSQVTADRLLVIGYVWPEPNSSAAGKHMLSLLKAFLQRGVKITFSSPAQRGEHKFDLTSMGIEEVPVALNCQSFDTFAAQLNPTYVLFDRFMMEEQFGWRVATSCPDAIRILDTEDLHFLRHARHQVQKDPNSPLEHDVSQSDQALREVAAIYRCDLTLVISQFEMDLLVNDLGVPQRLLHYCPFMLDLSMRPSAVTPFERRQHFVSIGSFRHAPNWDAVLYLNNTIWPKIRAELPEAELHIYGSYPPPKATQLHNPRKGFFVDGWVDDADTMLEEAKVLLAPLRFGAGLKGKLTDAMMNYTPSVTTPIGAQGITSSAQWPGMIEVSADDFANAAIQLYNNNETWATASHKTTAVLEQNFEFGQHSERLWQAICEIRRSLDQHRNSNFTGRMLQHHTMKSTQYMSQWIEAKNRKI